MQPADLLAFPPARIVRHRMKSKAKRSKPAPVAVAKKSPVLIAWTGLVMIAKAWVWPTLAVLAGAGLLRFLGL
jgi:hypothetical protein